MTQAARGLGQPNFDTIKERERSTPSASDNVRLSFPIRFPNANRWNL